MLIPPTLSSVADARNLGSRQLVEMLPRYSSSVLSVVERPLDPSSVVSSCGVAIDLGDPSQLVTKRLEIERHSGTEMRGRHGEVRGKELSVSSMPLRRHAILRLDASDIGRCARLLRRFE